MYCSNCGRQVSPGLTYCNHCGARLNESLVSPDTRLSKIPGESLVWAIVGVFVVGIGSIIGLMAVLKEEFNAPLGLALAVGLTIFMLTLLVEAVFIWQLIGHRRVPGAKEQRRLKDQTTRELEPAQAEFLGEPVPSVTEHTTRTFVPLYNERKSE
ncbi:MAG TPA: zinc-ribbon domain-containing protein [Pyrinomonadaceae bacterium]|nr:zinc-ribbon domain-containing protein [Pyrinomonadaceae bacterium]